MTHGPARRRTPSDQVSAALLNAAETVLDRDGAGGVTVRAVAREASVAPMSVYNRFGSKEGLLTALAIRALDELADVIDMPAGPDPVERFREACRAYRRFALGHPARYMLIFATGTPLRDQKGAAAEHGHEVFGILVSLVEGMVGGLPARDPTETAQAVWSAVHGAVTIEHAGIVQTADAEASFAYLLDMLVPGI